MSANTEQYDESSCTCHEGDPCRCHPCDCQSENDTFSNFRNKTEEKFRGSQTDATDKFGSKRNDYDWESCHCQSNSTTASECRCSPCECEKERPLLQEVYRTARMGIDSIEAVKKVADGGTLNALLNRQRAGYVQVSDAAEKVAFEAGLELTPTPLKDKAMLWGGVMMNSVTDKSPSKLAEMLIQGTNMGIIALTKALNKYGDNENQTLANKLLHQFNDNLTELKEYL